MCAPAPPPPTDFAGVAREQGAANREAAIAGGRISNPWVSNPYGTRRVLYNTPTGSPYDDVPFVEDTLTPAGQQLFDKDLALKNQIADTAQTSIGNVQKTLATPFSLSKVGSGNEIADAMFRRARRQMDPVWEQQEERERDRLLNAGFSFGSDDPNTGENRAMSNFYRGRDTAYQDAADRAILGGRDERRQLIQEALLERQQPLTELASLRSGSQPNVPNFGGTSGANVTPANLLGAAQAASGQANDIYNSQVGQSNANMSGLFSLGSAAVMGAFM